MDFLISERWGGSAILRQAIAREIDFLIEDLANDLQRVEYNIFNMPKTYTYLPIFN